MQQFRYPLFNRVADRKPDRIMDIQHQPADFKWILLKRLFKRCQITAMHRMLWYGDDMQPQAFSGLPCAVKDTLLQKNKVAGLLC